MNESRVKNTSRNIIYAAIFQFVKIALVFIGRIVFVKKLGAAYLGVNGLFSNILSLLSLADLGITTALMYSLYKPLAEHDENKIAQYTYFFKDVYRIIALVVAVFGIALIPFLKYLVNLPTDMPNIYLYYVLLLANSVISYLYIYRTTILSADQKMFIINKYDTIFQFVLFLMQMLVLFLTNSFALYLLCNIISTFLSNVLKVNETKKIYPYLKKMPYKKLSKTEKKEIFKNLSALFFYRIGVIIQSNTDNILISIFVGTIAVGYYSNYSMIILSITTFLTMVFTSLKASVGNFIANKDKNEQLKMFNLLEIYNFWLVGLCSVCFVTLIPDFIVLCFGKEYLLSFGLLICAVLNFYTSNIRQTIWAFRETTGMFVKTKYITIVTSIINLILSILLGYYFGLVGIILATVISRMLYAWWKEPSILFKDYFESSSKQYFINYVKRLLLIISICCISLLICSFIPDVNIYLKFIIECMVSIIIPIGLFYIIYNKSDAMVYIKKNILKR